MTNYCITNTPLTKKQILNTLNAAPYCTLGTCNDNTPQVRTYLYAFDTCKNSLFIYLDIVIESVEYTNLLVNPNVSIQFENDGISSENYQQQIFDTVSINGIAYRVTDEDEIDCIKAKLSSRNALNKVGLACISSNYPSAIFKIKANNLIANRNQIIVKC